MSPHCLIPDPEALFLESGVATALARVKHDIAMKLDCPLESARYADGFPLRTFASFIAPVIPEMEIGDLRRSRSRRRCGRNEAGMSFGVSEFVHRTQSAVAGIELEWIFGALPLGAEPTVGTHSRETKLKSLLLSAGNGLWVSTECRFAPRPHTIVEFCSSSAPQVSARVVNFFIGTPSQRLIATGGSWIVSSNGD